MPNVETTATSGSFRDSSTMLLGDSDFRAAVGCCQKCEAAYRRLAILEKLLALLGSQTSARSLE